MNDSPDPLDLILHIEAERKKFLRKLLKENGLNEAQYYRLRENVANALPEDWHVEVDGVVFNVVKSEKRLVPTNAQVVITNKRIKVN